MLAKYSLIVVKTAETFNYRVSLKEECFCRSINTVALLNVELHGSVGNWNFLLKICNSQVVYNHAGKVTVVVSFCRGIVFKGVTSEEKFADVSTSIMLNQKFSSWMIIRKFTDLKH